MPYVYHFVIAKMPTNENETAQLSLGMSDRYGIDGCELISVTPMPNSTPPSVLLAFQQPTA
jgi:hypothetical protein